MSVKYFHVAGSCLLTPLLITVNMWTVTCVGGGGQDSKDLPRASEYSHT